MRGRYSNKFNIFQRTVALCPPILGYVKKDRPKCTEINNQIFQYIKKLNPDKVVLVAWWGAYDWASVRMTIQALKNSGVKEVHLVGPYPEWEDQLPRLVYRKFLYDPFHRTPERMAYGLKSDYSEIDQKMSILASESGAIYTSINKILCNKSGCSVSINGSPISFDNAHLSIEGSKLLVSLFESF
jgi:hypothetical protein